jgi:hypothetical protein
VEVHARILTAVNSLIHRRDDGTDWQDLEDELTPEAVAERLAAAERVQAEVDAWRHKWAANLRATAGGPASSLENTSSGDAAGSSEHGGSGAELGGTAGSGKIDDVTAGNGKNDGLTGGSGKKDGLTAGSGKNDGLTAGSGKNDGLTAGSGKNDGLTAGSGKKDGLTGGSGKNDGLTAGSGKNDGLTAGSGKKDGLTAGSGKNDGLTAGSGNSNGLTAGAVQELVQAAHLLGTAGAAKRGWELDGESDGENEEGVPSLFLCCISQVRARRQAACLLSCCRCPADLMSTALCFRLVLRCRGPARAVPPFDMKSESASCIYNTMRLSPFKASASVELRPHDEMAIFFEVAILTHIFSRYDCGSKALPQAISEVVPEVGPKQEV